jgi:hypothetical protein
MDEFLAGGDEALLSAAEPRDTVAGPLRVSNSGMNLPRGLT